MKSVFQVVATMVLANATVAYGADAKSAVTNAKQGAAATAADAKTKAGEVLTGAKTQANEVKATVKDAAQDATKKADASQPAASQPAAAPAVTAQDVKDAAKEVKEAVAAQGDSSSLAGKAKSLIIPESAVLPESVLRFRAIYGAATSTKGYDSNGNKIENGLKITANQSIAVLEYGITDRISAQLLMPYSLGGKVVVDDKDKFTNTRVNPGIAAKAGTNLDGIVGAFKTAIPVLATGAAGPEAKAFAQAYQAGQPLPIPVDMSKFNAAFAGVTIPANTNIKTFVDEQFKNALFDVYYNAGKTQAESTKFQEGLGDVQLGAKYALSTVNEPWFDGIPFYASAGVGVRFATSKYLEAKKEGKEPAGRGTTDLGVRLNADYEIVNGLQVQLENQSEMMLAKGKTYAGGKEVDLKRNGMRQQGYTKLVLAPGTWLEGAEFLMLNARYNWDNDMTKTVDGVEDKTLPVARAAQFGLTLDGLKLKVPVQLDYDRIIAARSRNVSASFDAHVVTLKAFYKF
ncbi:MAG: hypothetical protein RLZZ488_803 [Pseudomonadota bacterium]|jgi:hypothetical protein